MEGRYEPVEIEELPGAVLQRYSRALGLYLLWEEGRLAWHDPAMGQPIAALEDERHTRLREVEGRLQAEVRAELTASGNPASEPRRTTGSWKRNCAGCRAVRGWRTQMAVATWSPCL